MSGKLRLALAAACGLLAALACVAYAREVRQEADRVRADAIARYGGEVVTLVVATHELSQGASVNASDVTCREWLADLAPEGAFGNIDDVIGLTVTNPVPKNAPITSLSFSDGGTSLDAPDGHSAVTVPVTDKLGIPRDLAIGSAVHAYAAQGDDTRLIATDMAVLATPARTSVSSSATTVTLSVPDDAVSAVLAASSAGDLRLVVPSATSPTTDAAATAAATAPPAATTTVEPVTAEGTGA